MKTIFTSALIVATLLSACTQNYIAAEDTLLSKKIPDLIREKKAKYKCFYSDNTSLKPENLEKLFATKPAFVEKFQNDLQNNNYSLEQIKEICYESPEVYLKLDEKKDTLSVAQWREEYGLRFFKDENGKIIYFNDVKNIVFPNAIDKDKAQKGHALVYLADSLSTPDKWRFIAFNRTYLTGIEIENCSKKKGCSKQYEEGEEIFTNQNLKENETDNSEKIQEETINEAEWKKCLKFQDNDGKNSCLLNFAKDDFYYSTEVIYQPKEICAEISESPYSKTECFWNYAMKTRDVSLCGFLPETASTDLANFSNDPYSQDYMTQLECQHNIHYEYENAEWYLAYGIPPYADPFVLSYEGQAEISGWIIYTPAYVSGDLPHFHLTEDSIKKMPPPLQDTSDYLIYYGQKGKNAKMLETQDELATIFKYNEKNPGKIKISGITVRMEGSPGIHFEQIVE